MHELQLRVSDTAYAEIHTLCDTTNTRLTELVRIGLGLVRLIINRSRRNQKIVVLSANGEPVEEIVLPGLQ